MKHFSHPHDLYVASMPSAGNQNIVCFGCKLPLFGTCYTCSGCQFHLHKFCFELPPYFHFKKHPNHSLTLLYSPYCHGQCDSCGHSCNGFTYNCSLCDYSVHASCAGSLEIKTKDDPDKYVKMFLWYKLSELNSVRGSRLMHSTGNKNEAEEAYKRQQMMKAKSKAKVEEAYKRQQMMKEEAEAKAVKEYKRQLIVKEEAEAEAEKSYNRLQIMKVKLQKTMDDTHMQQMKHMSDSMDFMNQM